ncbi:MAG: hypothetical protein NTZ16_00640, partial [Verrucomicrobia bacterium]|nr:hypothetical protein [Verrucomicrobiota bacterium]
MLKSVHLLFALLLLAGCATHRRPEPAPNWEGTNAVPVVPPPKLVTPPPPPPATNRFAPVWIPLEFWTRSNGLTAPVRISAGTQASYAITTPRGVLAIKTGSRNAHWDGMNLQLGYAPQETNGHLFVHTLDARKNLQPLLAAVPLPPKNSRVIVIDPG